MSVPKEIVAILLPLSLIPPRPRKKASRMSDFIRPKRLTFVQQMGLDSKTKMGLSPKPKIKPFLGEEVEAPKNLNIDLNKYECSKPYTQTDKDCDRRKSG